MIYVILIAYNGASKILYPLLTISKITIIQWCFVTSLLYSISVTSKKFLCLHLYNYIQGVHNQIYKNFRANN